MNENMETAVLRGTVLKVLTSGSADGLTRMVISGNNDFINTKYNGRPVMVVLRALSEISPGDVVSLNACVTEHPAYSKMLSAEAVPAADVNIRLNSFLASSVISAAVSANPYPASSVKLIRECKARVVRRPGEIRDPFIARAVRMFEDSRIDKFVGHVLFVQPGSIPSDEKNALSSVISVTASPEITESFMKDRARKLFGPVWESRPGNSGPVRNSAIMSGVPEPAVYAVDTGFRELLCVMPYDPVSPSCVQWHTVTGLPGNFYPRETMEPEAECEITARHEAAHLIQNAFLSGEISVACRSMMSECFCDAMAIMGYLQDGGKPEEVRKWISMRYLGALSGQFSHASGSACEDAFIKGNLLRKLSGRGISCVSPYDMAVQCIIIAQNNTPDNPQIFRVLKTAGDTMRNSGRRKVIRVLRELIVGNESRDGILSAQISGIQKALETVWFPVEMKRGGTLQRALSVQKNSMLNHLQFLQKYDMAGLSGRSLEIFRTARPSEIATSAAEGKDAGSFRISSPVTVVSEYFDIRIRMEGLLKKQVFSIPEPSGAPVQPYVIRRPSVRKMLRGSKNNEVLYSMPVIKRLENLAVSLNEFRKACNRKNIEEMERSITESLNIAFSLCIDPTAFRTARIYLGQLLTEELLDIRSMLASEQWSVFLLQENEAELHAWASGSMFRFSETLYVLCRNNILHRVSRHEMWIDGLPEGERLNGHKISFNKTDLSGRRLDGAILHNPDFSGAKMDGTSVRSAVMSNPVFRGTYLNRVDNTGTDIPMSAITESIGSVPFTVIPNSDEERRKNRSAVPHPGSSISEGDANSSLSFR